MVTVTKENVTCQDCIHCKGSGLFSQCKLYRNIATGRLEYCRPIREDICKGESFEVRLSLLQRIKNFFSNLSWEKESDLGR